MGTTGPKIAGLLLGAAVLFASPAGAATTLGPGEDGALSHLDSASQILFVDRTHTATAPGHLTSVDFFAAADGRTARFLLLDGDDDVRWTSPDVTTTQGTSTYTPAVPPPVRPGDALGWYLADAGVIPFDVGGPDQVMWSSFPRPPFAVGDHVAPGGGQARTYSIGATVADDVEAPRVAIDAAPSPPADPSRLTTGTIAWTATDDVTPSGALTAACALDGEPVTPCSAPVALTGLDEGPHAFAVTVTDEAGNEATATHAWTVDRTPPALAITAAPDAHTKDTTAVVAFDDGDAVAARCKLDDGAFASCAGGDATYPGLADGLHVVTVEAADTAGNTAQAVAAFTVDTVAPTASFTSGPADGSVVSAATASFGLDADEPATFRCRLDGGAWAACTDPHALSDLHKTAHTLELEATDPAGNTGGVARRSWAVDGVTAAVGAGDTVSTDTEGDGADGGEPLEVGLATPVAGQVTVTLREASAGAAGFTLLGHEAVIEAPTATVADPLTLTFRVAAGVLPSGITAANLQLLRDGVRVTACTGATSAAPDPCVTDRETLGDGDVRLTVRTSHASLWQLAQDTTPPQTTITAQPGDPARPDHPTDDTAATFAFTGADAVSATADLVYECRRDGEATFTACSSPLGFTAAEGTRSFEVRAIDASGNADPTPASWTWLVDLTDPTIDVVAPAVRTQDAWSAGDPRRLVQPSYVLHGGDTPQVTCADPPAGSPAAASGVRTCPHGGIDTETLGNHLLTATSTDWAGNSADPVVRAYRTVPPDYEQFVRSEDPALLWGLDGALGTRAVHDDEGRHPGVAQHGVVFGRSTALNCERWQLQVRPTSGCDHRNFERQGWAAAFDGRDDHLYANDVPAVQRIDANGSTSLSSPGFTLSLWARPTGSGGVAEHGNELQLWYSGGRFHGWAIDGTTVSVPATPGAWHHVGLTWDGSTLRLQVDGHATASATTHGNAPGGAPTFVVGRANQSGLGTFKGELDEVAYFHRPVSQHALRHFWEIGVYEDQAAGDGEGVLDMTRPAITIHEPSARATFNRPSDGKDLPVPPGLRHTCSDPDGASRITSCTATLDGAPFSAAADGRVELPIATLAPGTHWIEVTAVNADGLRDVQRQELFVGTFRDVVRDAGDWAEPRRPVAYWRLDDDAEAQTGADDGGRHPGTYRNDTTRGPAGISGDGNTTRRFLGRGGYLEVNDLPAGTLSWTVAAWVRPDDREDMVVLDHGQGGSGPALLLRGERVVLGLPGGGELVAGTSFPYDGAFHQVAATWDGVTATLYLDGAAVGSREALDAPSGRPTFFVGFGNVGLARPWFRGGIDEVAFYDRALTPERLLEHFQSDPPATGPLTGSGGATSGGDAGGRDGAGEGAATSGGRDEHGATAVGGEADGGAGPPAAVAAPAVAAPSSSAAAGDGGTARLLTDPGVSGSSASITVRLRCPAGDGPCRGRLTVRTASGRVVAATSYRLRAGRTARVRATVPRARRSALRRGRLGTLTITATPAGSRSPIGRVAFRVTPR